MLKKIAVICGIIFFLVGIGLGSYLIIQTTKASGLDRSEISPGGAGGGAGGAIGLICSASMINVSHLMTIDETQAVVVAISNNSNVAACDASVSLYTLDFDISPQESIRDITISPNQTVSTGWVLRPRTLGTFKIEIVTGAIAHFFGITVTNIFGLNAWQAQLLSMVGTFLGPITGAAWWYERWREHKRRKSNAVNPANTTAQASKAAQPSQSRKRAKYKRSPDA